jgi:hypothetical protein
MLGPGRPEPQTLCGQKAESLCLSCFSVSDKPVLGQVERTLSPDARRVNEAAEIRW